MASNNNWTGFGRLTKDPELRTFDKNGETQSVANFTLACDRYSKNDHYKADFVRCKVFGKRAETLAQYVKKGSRLLVSGALHQESYQDKEGNQRTDWSVTVDDYSFCDTKAENGGQTAPAKPAADTRPAQNSEPEDSDLPW